MFLTRPARFAYAAYELRWGDPWALLSEWFPPDGLLSPRHGYVGWWRFDEGGGQVVDWSTNRWATEVAGVGVRRGVVGAAGAFGGAGSHARVERLPALSGGFSAEASVLFDGVAAGGRERVLRYGEPAGEACGGGFEICRSGDEAPEGVEGELLLSTWDEGEQTLGQAAPGPGEWVPVAVVWTDGQASFHAGGRAPAEGPLAYRAPARQCRALHLGGEADPARGLDGALDEVRIMSRALAPEELLQLPLSSWSAGAVDDLHCPDGPLEGVEEVCWNDRDEDCDGEWDEGCSTCVGTVCPAHPLGWPPACDAQGHCEYVPQDDPLLAEVFVPPGVFPMGSPEEEEERHEWEGPVHEVTFASGFWIGKYEVTVEQYAECPDCGAPSVADWSTQGLNTVEDGRADHPQNGLQWQQAVDYCEWRGMRLPSEAEWEYAAKGPVHRTYPWGDEPEPTCANDTAVFDDSARRDECEGNGTMAVGSKPAGAAWSGALDMAGNLWEWVEDCWHDSYDEDGTRPEDGSAWTDNCSNSHRVYRGGSFYSGAAALRAAARNSDPPEHRVDYQGARCVRPLLP